MYPFNHSIISATLKMAVVVCGILFQCVDATFGQEPIFQRYTIDDGLPSSEVYFTSQDSKGYIWTCTDKGLAKFDGYTFDTYTTNDGLPSNDVFGLTEDKVGRIWLNTFDELCYYQNGQFHIIPSEIAKGEIVFHSIDTFGNHFIIFDERLYELHHDSLKLIEHPHVARLDSYVLFDEGARAIAKKNNYPITDPDKSLLYAKGNFCYDEDHLFRDFHDSPDWTGYLIGVMSLSDFKVALVLSRYILLFEKNQPVKKLPVELWDEGGNILRATSMLGAHEKSDEQVWIKTNDSIFVLDNELKKKDISYHGFLNSYNVNTMSIDRNENLWISTKSGLFFLGASARFSSSFNLGTSENENVISSLDIDEEGAIWIGNAEGSLFRLTNDELVEIIIPLFKGDLLRAIATNDNDLYIGGTAGIHVLQKNKLIEFVGQHGGGIWEETKGVLINANPFGAVKSVELKKNKLLIASSHGGYSFEKKQIPREISSSRAYAIASDEHNNIWIGHTDGIEFFKNGRLFDLRKKGGVYSVSITDLQFDENNYLWTATGGFGLHVLVDSGFVAIEELEGEIINSIHVDHQNHVWAASNKGVIKITPTGYDPFNYDFRRLTKAHGLPSDEVTHVRAFHDSIFVATKSGLCILQGEYIDKKYEPPVFLINSISINGRDTIINDYYNLPHWQNNIEIDYVCLSYKSNKNIVYYYQLEGIDNDWRATKNLNKEYPTLPSGDYAFKIKAEDVDGLTTEEKLIRFRILPPWWKAAWFQILLPALFIIATYCFVKWRVYKVKQKSAASNIINKKFAELELKALQAQMNPHFIFNAINSIQDFIFKNDERTANRYLVKFSRLMRLFLEASKKKYVFLEDEVEMIRLYIELEKLRFGDKFDYDLTINDSIEACDIEVPSMMIQPFIENAINHGLVYKNDKGYLSIHMEVNGSVLTCIIEDNGIGRKKAQELKDKSYKSYISRGMQLVDERQKMLSYIENLNIDVLITDLENEFGEGIGTIVEIKIPFS